MKRGFGVFLGALWALMWLAAGQTETTFSDLPDGGAATVTHIFGADDATRTERVTFLDAVGVDWFANQDWGDLSVSGGVVSIDAGVIVDADINASAAIAGTKLGAEVLLQTELDTFAELDALVADQTLSKASDIGVTVQGFDADLADLSDGSLTGSKVAVFGGDSGAGGTQGAVPAPAAGDAAAGKYLAAGGTWTVPAGSGGDAVSVDGGATVDPDFVSSGDIDFVNTTNTITANLNAGVIVDADINASAAIAGTKLGAEVLLQTELDTFAELDALVADQTLSKASDIGVTLQAYDADLDDLADGQLTGTKVGLMVGDSGAGGSSGAVPAPASGDAAAGKYLHADGTWTTPATGGLGTNLTSSTNDLLSNIGNIVFAGTAGTNNEQLKLDLETTANTAIWTSNTGVTLWDLSAFDINMNALSITGNLDAGTLTVTSGTAPASAVEGRIQWDEDDDVLVVGDGTSTVTFLKTIDDATIDFGAASLEIPNSATPAALTAAGQVVVDTNILTGTTGQGLAILHDGTTAATYQVATLDLPADNEIPKYDSTTGTITWEADVSGGSPSFDGIATGTNTTATMTVGTGASIVPSGSGSITATVYSGTALTDAQVSDTLTASILVGSGSTTNAVDLATAEVAGILGGANGGTGNGFTQFSGPTTATKTFTLPDASATILTTNDAVTDAQVSDTLTASILVGSGSTTNAVDLATAEVAGTLPVGNIAPVVYQTYDEKHATAHTLSIDSTTGEGYSSVHYVTAASTLTLPAVTDGTSFTVITVGAIAVSVDSNASDLIMLDGTALDDGDKITNTSTSGDIAVFTYYDATGWYAATNGWTDGGP